MRRLLPITATAAAAAAAVSRPPPQRLRLLGQRQRAQAHAPAGGSWSTRGFSSSGGAAAASTTVGSTAPPPPPTTGTSTSGGAAPSSAPTPYPWAGGHKEPPTTFGDHRRAYPLPRKRSVGALPLEVQHSDRFVVSRRGQALYLQTYWPPLAEPRAVVFLVHDYGDHSGWFLRDLAVLLVQQGYGVVAMDLEGHGRSDGLAGNTDIRASVMDLCDHYGALAVGDYHAKPCFLLGEGLGGTLAYQTYQMQGGRFWDGLVLLSPTLAFPKRLRPPPFLLSLARRLGPSGGGLWPVVPYSQLYLDWLTDPGRRQEVLENPLWFKQGMRINTCLQLLDATDEMQQHFEEQTAPFLILQGEEDPLHDPNAARALYTRAKSLDKTLRLYAGARHCLLGPPAAGGGAAGGGEDVKRKVGEDVVGWLEERCRLAANRAAAGATGGGAGGLGGGVGRGDGGGMGGGGEQDGPFEDPETEHRP